jgi:hypothetical protein
MTLTDKLVMTTDAHRALHVGADPGLSPPLLFVTLVARERVAGWIETVSNCVEDRVECAW